MFVCYLSLYRRSPCYRAGVRHGAGHRQCSGGRVRSLRTLPVQAIPPTVLPIAAAPASPLSHSGSDDPPDLAEVLGGPSCQSSYRRNDPATRRSRADYVPPNVQQLHVVHPSVLSRCDCAAHREESGKRVVRPGVLRRQAAAFGRLIGPDRPVSSPRLRPGRWHRQNRNEVRWRRAPDRVSVRPLCVGHPCFHWATPLW